MVKEYQYYWHDNCRYIYVYQAKLICLIKETWSVIIEAEDALIK